MIAVHHLANSSLAGTRQALSSAKIKIGRRPECDVRFDAEKDVSVSGVHLEARLDGTRILVRDLGSTNGTFVNGVRITSEVELKPSDVLRLGASGPELRLTAEGELAATAATPSAPATKQGVGVQTLERAISSATLAERTKHRRSLLLGIGALALAGAGVAWWQLRRQEEIGQAVNATQSAVLETRKTAEEARELAANARAELDRSLADVRKRHDQELAALAGKISAGEGKVSSLIVEIEERNRALAEIEAKAENASAADEALRLELESKLQDLSGELAAQEQTLRDQAGKVADWAALVERYKGSVFLCLAQSKPDENGNWSQSIGTAWVCREDGILATNSHVATFMQDPAQWKLLKCVQNDTGRLFDVEEVMLDPRWTGKAESPDVALVRIDTGGETLVALPMASAEELRALRIGTQLGTMGYPGELTWDYVHEQEDSGELLHAQATFKDGWIGRILDFSGKRNDFEQSYFIQHSASLSGGTSGSPMFTKDGVVVALNNSGQSLFVKVKADDAGTEETERVSNPAEIGYAVRVDLLQELLRDSGW